jgi:hypothetical protein
MAHRFYEEPISDFVRQKLTEMRGRVEQLTEAQLEAPGLGEILNSLSRLEFNLAVLKPHQRKGKRRTEKRQINDYGRQIAVDFDIIDVTVPFDGWPQSFSLAPSSYTLIDIPITITSQPALQFSLPDDQNLDRDVDGLIQRISSNLNMLRSDMRGLETQRLQEAQLVANQRLKQIQERRDRDKKRSFPIE